MKISLYRKGRRVVWRADGLRPRSFRIGLGSEVDLGFKENNKFYMRLGYGDILGFLESFSSCYVLLSE